MDERDLILRLAGGALATAIVLGVAFQVCELLGPVARAVACAIGLVAMVAFPLGEMRAILGPTARPGRGSWGTMAALLVTLGVPMVVLGMQGQLDGGTAAVLALLPGVAFLASLGRGLRG